MAKFAPLSRLLKSFISILKTDRKQADAYALLDLYRSTSQKEAVVRYPNIIGFGRYHYQYDSGHEGDAPVLAFAPRQAKLSLYIDQDLPDRKALLAKLGRHKAAVGCVYVNKLADIDLSVLEEILQKTLERRHHF